MTATGKQKMTVKDIRELMRLMCWTQAELARQLDVTDGAVTRWMSGEHPPMGPARILMREWLDRARAAAKEPALSSK